MQRLIDAAEAALGALDNIIDTCPSKKANLRPIRKFLADETRKAKKKIRVGGARVINEALGNTIWALQQIHDEADHILGTEAENVAEIAHKNAKEIKRLAAEALTSNKRS